MVHLEFRTYNEVVKVRGSKSAAVKLNHRTDIRRNYRNSVKNHPFKLIAAVVESINNIKPFKKSYSLLTCSTLKFCSKFITKLSNINSLKKLFNSLGAHACLKVVLVSFSHFSIFFFIKNLHLFKWGVTGIGNNVKCKIKHLFKVSRADIKYKTEAARNTLKIPNMRNRSCKLDMTHALTADAGFCNLNAAAVTDNSLITNSLIFTAMTFPILHRSENSFAEKTVTFRFKSSVVYCFRLCYFAVRPFTNLLR